ncbi:MAG: FMN-binding protein [Alloprevotella sp.]|nr:FMN-binding protein [Alloprevotella sp.]
MNIKSTLIILLMSLTATLPIQAQKSQKATAQNTATVSEPSAQQLQKLGLTDATLKEVRSGIWKVSVKKRNKGYVINSGVYSQGTVGYNGNTPLLVYIANDKKVTSIVSLRNRETPNYYQYAEKILKNWSGKPVKQAANMNVDAVSGATYSSKAIIKNVQVAIDAYNKYCK